MPPQPPYLHSQSQTAHVVPVLGPLGVRLGYKHAPIRQRAALLELLKHGAGIQKLLLKLNVVLLGNANIRCHVG